MKQQSVTNHLIELEEGSAENYVRLLCLELGGDLQIIVYGGQAHVGAVAAGVCYDKKLQKSNASVIALHGHKEDQLAAMTATRISKSLGRNVAVTAGIHYDNLDKPGISKIVQNVEILIERIIEQLKGQA